MLTVKLTLSVRVSSQVCKPQARAMKKGLELQGYLTMLVRALLKDPPVMHACNRTPSVK